MKNLIIPSLLLTLAAGCTPATWTLETWGEEYIEDHIPGDAFSDGCTLTYDEFLVSMLDPALLDGGEQAVSDLPAATVWDLTAPGPHEVGSADVPARTYSRMHVTVGPASAASVSGNVSDDQLSAMVDSGAALRLVGTLTCGEQSVSFDWTFDSNTTYRCEPELTLAAGGEGRTQFTVHGDHLFYDGLEDPEAVLRAQPLIDADDGDGDLTLDELRAVSLAPLGDYDVGGMSQVQDLAAFVEYLATTVGHVDGEGHCSVAR